MKLERNLLAEFYMVLFRLAYARDQLPLALEYLHLANSMTR